jgi:hypothetical protein
LFKSILDDYTQTNIDEFGTNKPSKIENRTRNEKSREKKLRLYSDDLLEKGDGEKQEEEKEKDLEDPIKNSNKRKMYVLTFLFSQNYFNEYIY